jgi:hypothetical protein
MLSPLTVEIFTAVADYVSGVAKHIKPYTKEQLTTALNEHVQSYLGVGFTVEELPVKLYQFFLNHGIELTDDNKKFFVETKKTFEDEASIYRTLADKYEESAQTMGTLTTKSRQFGFNKPILINDDMRKFILELSAQDTDFGRLARDLYVTKSGITTATIVATLIVLYHRTVGTVKDRHTFTPDEMFTRHFGTYIEKFQNAYKKKYSTGDHAAGTNPHKPKTVQNAFTLVLTKSVTAGRAGPNMEPLKILSDLNRLKEFGTKLRTGVLEGETAGTD